MISLSFSGLGWEEKFLVHTQARFKLEMVTGWLLRGLCRMITALGPFSSLPAPCHRGSFVWSWCTFLLAGDFGLNLNVNSWLFLEAFPFDSGSGRAEACSL